MLRLLAKIYATVMQIRNHGYDNGWLKSFSSELPVISIGNMSVGGNAKTPLTIYLVKLLQEKGLSPVVLTRGYGGKVKGPYQVSENDSAKLVGDEPLLILRRTGLPVVVCRDRVLGASFISQKKLGNVIVLDDGFQHRRLRRLINIVSVDVGSEKAIEDFIEGRVLPWGRFREDREKAMQRVDCLVFATRRYYKVLPPLDERLREIVPNHIPVFRSSLVPEGIVSIKKQQELNEKNIVAVCGIAKPERFFATLTELGFNVVATKAFNDHHTFCKSDFDDLKKKYPDCKIVCTEKDGVKIDPAIGDDIFVLRTSTKVEAEDSFLQMISEKLQGGL